MEVIARCFQRPKKSNSVAIYRTNPKAMLNFYFVYNSIQNNTTEKLYLNILTFINRNIISVSTWLIWATTQLRVRMNVRFTGSRSMLMYSLYESVIVLLSLSFISSTELWTDTWVQDWLFGSPVKID